LRIAVADNSVGQTLQQRVVEITVLDLDLHGEAADVANALNRGWRERERYRLRDVLQRGVQVPVDRDEILPLFLEACVPVVEDDKGDTCVGEGCHIVEYGNATDGDHMVDAGDRLRDF
jgi:hypothetical protein